MALGKRCTKIKRVPRLFDNFGLTYWGLQARMQQSLESARVARETKGKQITAKTGVNTKEMKAWRSLGRAMLDIRVLIFNLGRVDYRKNIWLPTHLNVKHH